jgi:hypothetical protein
MYILDIDDSLYLDYNELASQARLASPDYDPGVAQLFAPRHLDLAYIADYIHSAIYIILIDNACQVLAPSPGPL